MGIDVAQWRASIGKFNKLEVMGKLSRFSLKQCFLDSLLGFLISCQRLFDLSTDIILLFMVSITMLTLAALRVCLLNKYLTMSFLKNLWWLALIVLLSGDVHENPGPGNLKILHWNVNSISTDNFIRKTLIEAYNVTTKYDVIAITETGLHSNTSNDVLEIEGYSLYRRDLPADRNYGGVIVYVSENIACQDRRDLETLQDQLILELVVNNKRVFVSSNYRKHHVDETELTDYMENFERSMVNIKSQSPFCCLFIGDYNSHNTAWLGSDRTDSAGELLNDIILQNGFQQLVTEPTHFMGNTKTCIDLVITDQPNLINECCIIPSLHNRCHHFLNHTEINISNIPPPAYYRRIWHYNRANWEAIRAALSSLNWQQQLNALSYSPDLQVNFLNETLMNVFTNFIPNKMKRVKARDPPWYNNNISAAYKRYNRKFRAFKRRGYPSDMLPEIENHKKIYADLVQIAKDAYLKTQGLKLNDKSTNAKTYWSILKNFTSSIKMPCIPPIFYNNNLISDFQKKAEAFNTYFADQCTVLETGSELPPFELLTQKKLNECTFSKDDIHSILIAIKENKSHGCDEISSKMISMCGESLVDPLFIIFNNCLSKGIFPKNWKKANVVPIHKKNKKNDITNYRPISLLPIFSKVFEKLIFNNLYSYLTVNSLITSKQSGFIKGDSTINQLLSIIEMIQKSFDCDVPKEVRGIFLDISKAFDKVWHPGLIHKLKQNGISDNMLQLLDNFLSDRFQRVTINGKTSSWRKIQAGVPQGSVLGPLLFLIYINDLIKDMKCDARIFADDTSIFKIVNDVAGAFNDLNHDLKIVEHWGRQWRMSFNPDPLKPPVEVIFSTKTKPPDHPEIIFNGIPLSRRKEHKHLGLILDKKLTFHNHIIEKINKTKQLLYTMKKTRHYIPSFALEQVYKSFIRSKLEYGDIIYGKCLLDSNNNDQPNPFLKHNTGLMVKLESVQYKAAIIIAGCWQGTSTKKVYDLLGWEYLSHRRWFRQMCFFYKIVKGIAPLYLTSLITQSNSLRNNSYLVSNIPTRTKRYKQSFFPSAIHSWNKFLTADQRRYPTFASFKSKLKLKLKKCKTSNFGLSFYEDIKEINLLRVGLSPLTQHKYLHHFSNITDDLCICGTTEDTTHFFRECPLFLPQRRILCSEIFRLTGLNLILIPRNAFAQTLLYGNDLLGDEMNKEILLCCKKFIKSTGRFL